jgi:bifunctional NMN adenylyltransferase/nudix hydrolase
MKDRNTLGVVVGRFQLPVPHAGQQYLINHALARHERTLVLCGHNERWPQVPDLLREPFPIEIQKQIVSSVFGDVLVEGIPDSPISTAHWSTVLDETVARFAAGGSAVLYGSRDSFITKYHGCFETCEVPPLGDLSATAIRNELSSQVPDDPMFRLGWLAAMYRQVGVNVQ